MGTCGGTLDGLGEFSNEGDAGTIGFVDSEVVVSYATDWADVEEGISTGWVGATGVGSSELDGVVGIEIVREGTPVCWAWDGFWSDEEDWEVIAWVRVDWGVGGAEEAEEGTCTPFIPRISIDLRLLMELERGRGIDSSSMIPLKSLNSKETLCSFCNSFSFSLRSSAISFSAARSLLLVVSLSTSHRKI